MGMKVVEAGKDKVQKICDAIRKETLEPAQQEAREIVENARLEAQEILAKAEKEAKKRVEETEKTLEEKKRVFDSSLQMACRQGIEWLKQKIEKELFDQELAHLVTQKTQDSKVIVHIIDSFFQIIQDRGIDDEFVVVIPKSISPRQISSEVAAKVLEKLSGEKIVLGEFSGGVKIQLKERAITIDISDEVVCDLIAQYIRRDFRELVFKK